MLRVELGWVGDRMGGGDGRADVILERFRPRPEGLCAWYVVSAQWEKDWTAKKSAAAGETTTATSEGEKAKKAVRVALAAAASRDQNRERRTHTMLGNFILEEKLGKTVSLSLCLSSSKD